MTFSRNVSNAIRQYVIPWVVALIGGTLGMVLVLYLAGVPLQSMQVTEWVFFAVVPAVIVVTFALVVRFGVYWAARSVSGV